MQFGPPPVITLYRRSGIRSSTTQPTYEVHLEDAEAAVSSDSLDFYDSGVWIRTGTGREFNPDGRILKIREVAASPEPEPETEPEEPTEARYEE